MDMDYHIMASFQNINEKIIACLIIPPHETEHCKITFVMYGQTHFFLEAYNL